MPPPQKVVVVAYKRWLFTRGSNYSALTGKNVVFQIGGRLWEVVAYERWSHMEVQLCLWLHSINLFFQGAGREGLYVQTEFIAVVAALLIWWSANNVKSKLQES